MKLTLLPIICLLAAKLHAADDPYFFSIKARSGDGIIVLLNRYELDENDCNVDKFLELNQLKKNDLLIAGRLYKIPVLIYTYNGQTIRSTLGIDDLEK